MYNKFPFQGGHATKTYYENNIMYFLKYIFNIASSKIFMIKYVKDIMFCFL